MRHFSITAFLSIALLCGAGIAIAETNISAPAAEHSAWNDTIGWIDFYTPDTVLVSGSKVTGYASSSAGDISLDCATSPVGNTCGAVNYGVCNGLLSTHEIDGTCSASDASGNLSGWAWNDVVGWISMSCRNHEGVGCTTYQVTIDANGNFQGWAWNDVVGWINFNCGNAGASCSPVAYTVNTIWRSTSSIAYVDSSIIDTQTQAGVVLNSISWQGTRPDETRVDFQIATSTSPSGPWAFVGPDGTGTSFYGAPCTASFIGGSNPTGAAPNTAICVNPAAAQGRYLRYRIRLASNLIQTATPQIDDVILHWSR